MNDALVRTENLSKKFKADFVLKDVNLSLDRGKIYALVGEKNAGKSTLLSLLSGLIKPSSGNVTSNADNSAFIIESPAIIDEMTVFDNMKTRCMLTGSPFSDIDALLTIVNLYEKSKIKAKKLTKSDKYSLGIALEFLSKPDFLALDEPFDVDIVMKIHSSNQTLLLTGENLSDYAKIADEFIIIHNGKIIKNITKEYLLTQVRDAFCLSVSDPDAAIRILDVKLGIKNADVEDGYLIVYNQNNNINVVSQVLSENAVRIYHTKHFHSSYEEYYNTLIGGDEI
ncbi:MAG: ATP-binding cassette domain-containing protein [Ruminococcus sp.]|jgi:ABC-2 type transport system ATP-binding protein|nr:ATP-binding cassette domain-containing protein [Ruminococcus sp.]